MKITNFNKKKSFIIGLKDEKIKKEKNLDQVIYFIVLITLFTIGGYFFIDYLVYVSGNGQVVMESVNVRIPDDARIIQFYKKEGDEIKTNDTLFSYIDNQSNFLTSFDSSSSYLHSNPEWIEKELFSLQEKREWNAVSIHELQKQLDKYESDYREALVQLKLNILPLGNCQKIKEDLENLKSRINILEQENLTAMEMIKSLMSKLKSINSGIALKENAYYVADRQNSAPAGEKKYNFFYAPITGFISRILKKTSELSLKQEDIIILQKKDKLFIRSFFDQKYIKMININDTIKLVFPDNTKSAGIVKQLHTGAYPVPDEFQQKIGLEEYTFGVDVYPLNAQESLKWAVYNGLSVKVFKSKF